jgi:hypothetical protein
VFYKPAPTVYTIIENFYDKPQDVVAMAKEFPIISCGPPKTLMLQEIQPEFNQYLFNLFLNFYGGPRPNKVYHLSSFFSKHDNTSEYPLVNNGQWRTAGHNPYTCRYDDSAEAIVVCGEVMLSENITEPGCEFEIGKVKPELNWTRQQFIDETCNYYTIPKEKYLAGEITYEQFEELYKKHESHYETFLTVKYEFNKLIFWRNEVVHRELRNQPILTQHIVLSEFDESEINAYKLE